MKNWKITIGKILALGLGTGLLLCGCGQETTQDTENLNYAEVTFPIQEDVTLRIWADNTHMVVKNLQDMGCYQEISKKTGVKFEIISPVAGQSEEQFNVMIASQEYPDIIEGVSYRYKGGLEKAWSDQVILELSDLTERCAPNLTKLYETYPQLKMEASNADGQMFAVPMIRGGNILRTYTGPVVRADYLEKFNLEIPETIEDWHTMLTVFKENGISYPFTAVGSTFRGYSSFIGAWNTCPGFFNDNGKVFYGPYEEGYKEYVKTMAQWYQEGLIDSEITTNDQKIADSKIMANGAGAFIGTSGNSVGGYLQQMASKDPEFDLQPVPYPVLNEGEKNRFIQRDAVAQTSVGASITTTAEHPDIAMAVLDYGFSKDGHMAYNFGVEGESYEMIDGYPTYTDLVMHNPDGLAVSKAGSLYARAFTSGPFVQDAKYGEQFYSMERQKEASEMWTKDLDAYNANPSVVRGSLTPEQTDEIASMQNEITTYVSEMFAKWLMGREDPETGFAAYQEQLRSMGLEKILSYYQEAQDRYLEAYPEMSQAQDAEISDYFWQD